MTDKHTPRDPNEQLLPMKQTPEQEQRMYQLMAEHPDANPEVKEWARSKMETLADQMRSEEKQK